MAAKNIENWEFEFDKIFHNSQTLPLLEYFAKQNLNQGMCDTRVYCCCFLTVTTADTLTLDTFLLQKENIEFLKYWDTFKKTIASGDIKSLVEQATHVRSTFIVINSKQELNLSGTIRNKASSLLDTLIDLKFENEETMREQLRQQFEDIAAGCVNGLVNVFTCFKRSDAFVRFVNKASEATLKQLGTHKRDLEMILLTVDDVERTYMTEKDIKFANLILKDYYLWKLINKNKEGDVLTFSSTHNWVADDLAKKYGYFTTLKIDLLLPNITPKELVTLEWSKEFHPKAAYNMTNLVCLEHIKPYTHKDQAYSNVVSVEHCFTVGLIGKIIAPREYLTAHTIIKQGEHDYLLIMRPCLSEKLPKEVPKGFIRGGLMYVYFLVFLFWLSYYNIVTHLIHHFFFCFFVLKQLDCYSLHIRSFKSRY